MKNILEGINSRSYDVDRDQQLGKQGSGNHQIGRARQKQNKNKT